MPLRPWCGSVPGGADTARRNIGGPAGCSDDNGRMDWQTSEDTVPSAPVTEADARLLLGRPPATGAWRGGDPVGERHFAAFGSFRTEGGRELPAYRLAYETWGELSATRDNAVLVLQALTGDSPLR